MPHKPKENSQKQQSRLQRLDEECHRITVIKLLACKATGRKDLGPSTEQAQKSIQKLKDVAMGLTSNTDGDGTIEHKGPRSSHTPDN